MFPVKRSTLINALMLKSLFNTFNLIAVFFFSAFTLSAVINECSLISAASWLISIIALEISNGYLVFYLQKKIAWKHGLLIPVLTILFVIIAYEIITSFSIKDISAGILGGILNYPIFAFIPLFLLTFIYYINFTSLAKHFYSDDLKKRKVKDKKFRNFSVFDRMGEIGLYMALELKMIFRNRRPRSLFYYSFMFLLFQITALKSSPLNVEIHNIKSLYIIYFWCTFAPSAAMFIYGQALFAWDGGYFDLICSRVSDIRNYIYAKYYIMVLSVIIFFVLLIPYGFIFGSKVFWFNAAGAIYSIGVNSVMILIVGPLNKKRIDLNTGMMSMQGRDSSGQFVKGLPIIITLGAIYLIVLISGYIDYVFHITAAVGIIGFLLRNKAIDLALVQFNKHRYKMAAGYRQS
jgi:hypothetical protein